MESTVSGKTVMTQQAYYVRAIFDYGSARVVRVSALTPETALAKARPIIARDGRLHQITQLSAARDRRRVERRSCIRRSGDQP